MKKRRLRSSSDTLGTAESAHGAGDGTGGGDGAGVGARLARECVAQDNTAKK